jgi:hypothetical protein
MFYDLATRELLRTRKNPSPRSRSNGCAAPARPPPRPSAGLVRVQRRASNTGVIMVVGQKIALGRTHRHQTVTVLLVSDTTPFVWTKSADDILETIAEYCQRIIDSGHQLFPETSALA